MQTIKKVILVVICFVVLLTSFSSVNNASAYFDDEFIADMVDAGWVYDSHFGDLYLPFSEEYNELPSFLTALSEPNFPDFDPTKLPWNEFPDYIQKIAYMGMDNANFSDTATYESIKVPFIMIRNTGSECSVFVGQNLALGTHQTSFAVRLCARTAFINANNSFCYSAVFDSNTYEQKSDWQRRVFSSWGDKDLIRYTAATTLVTLNGSFDFYFYGGNAQTTVPVTTLLTYIYSSDNSNVVAFVNQTPSGFQNTSAPYAERFFSDLDRYNFTYAAYFQPPSASQIEAETQKGIWESIKELPSKITEGIRSLLDKMLNYILYFQETKPDHVNPFEDILADVKVFFNDQMSDVDDFKDTLTSTLDNVVSYIQTGSGVVNTFLTAVPVLSAFITFFVVFCIVRKVIGR